MRRDVQEIFKATPHEKQCMMFSATLPKEIRPVCKKFMDNVIPSLPLPLHCSRGCAAVAARSCMWLGWWQLFVCALSLWGLPQRSGRNDSLVCVSAPVCVCLCCLLLWGLHLMELLRTPCVWVEEEAISLWTPHLNCMLTTVATVLLHWRRVIFPSTSPWRSTLMMKRSLHCTDYSNTMSSCKRVRRTASYLIYWICLSSTK